MNYMGGHLLTPVFPICICEQVDLQSKWEVVFICEKLHRALTCCCKSSPVQHILILLGPGNFFCYFVGGVMLLYPSPTFKRSNSTATAQIYWAHIMYRRGAKDLLVQSWFQRCFYPTHSTCTFNIYPVLAGICAGYICQQQLAFVKQQLKEYQSNPMGDSWLTFWYSCWGISANICFIQFASFSCEPEFIAL